MKIRNRGEKVKIFFLKGAGDTPSVIDTKTARNTDESISFKGKTFIIPANGAFEQNGIRQVFFNYDMEKVSAFQKIDLGYDAEWLDDFVLKKLIAQLVARIKNDMNQLDKSKILTYIMLLAGGGLGGYVIGESLRNSATTAAMAVLAWL